MSQNTDPIIRSQGTVPGSATTVLPTTVLPGDDSARLREEAQAARAKALGKVEPGQPVAAPPVAQKRVTDKFFGSLGLFALRLVAAAVLAVYGYQHLSDIGSFTDYVTKVGLPSPHYLAWGIAICEVLGAVALLFGALTRVAGLGLAALMVCALVFVKWGAVNPFQAGTAGFIGELELVLAGLGLAILCLGGGRWSIDGSVRIGRERARAAL